VTSAAGGSERLAREILEAGMERQVAIYDGLEHLRRIRAAALERHGVVERTAVYGGANYLAKVKAANPRIRLLPPLGSPAALDALARDLKPYAVDARWEILSPELISRCHALGIRVFSDALGQHERIEDYEKAMDWGLDLIQTDYP
jgi:glycerophosphoryl diester phosphodiesterase